MASKPKPRRKPKRRAAAEARERLFIQAYAGNATEAAIAAGCPPNTASRQGTRLLSRVHVREAIRRREDFRTKGTIAKRQERQELWTEMMRDHTLKPLERARFSELLGKSEADFTERHEVKGEFTLLDLVRESMQPTKNGELTDPLSAEAEPKP